MNREELIQRTAIALFVEEVRVGNDCGDAADYAWQAATILADAQPKAIVASNECVACGRDSKSFHPEECFRKATAIFAGEDPANPTQQRPEPT